MRILGFTKKWSKLSNKTHTTFRFPRRDADKGRDWAVGEVVQEIYKPRSKEREFIQFARIIKKEPKDICAITDKEAIEDGFPGGWYEMKLWLEKTHGTERCARELINKLTLQVVEREV